MFWSLSYLSNMPSWQINKYINTKSPKSGRMYSSEKYGKLKKQINRYFLPLQINAQILIEALRNQEKKSPSKIRNNTLNKLAEESKKMELLTITGKEMSAAITNNQAFTPISFKAPQNRGIASRGGAKDLSSYKHSFQQLLNHPEPIRNIVDTIIRDPQGQTLYSYELKELMKMEEILDEKMPAISSSVNLGMSEGEHLLRNKLQRSSEKIQKLKETQKFSNFQQFSKFQKINQNSSQKIETMRKVQKLILANPTLYKKLIHSQQRQHSSPNRRIINATSLPIESNTQISKRKSLHPSSGTTSTFPKKIYSHQDKNLTPAELKKCKNFIQYREFLMLINLSNCIAVHPQNQGQFKAYICKGNNGLLVKSILKTRPWWALRAVGDIDQCNLVWTEWKKSKLTQSLPKRQNSVVKDYPITMTSYRSSFYLTNFSEKMNPPIFKLQAVKTEESPPSCAVMQKNNTQINSPCLPKDRTLKISKDVQTPSTEKVTGNKKEKGTMIQNRGGKCLQVERLIKKVRNFINERFLNFEGLKNYDPSYDGYLTFTQKINEKKFEQIFHKNLPQIPMPAPINPCVKILNHLPGCLNLHSKKLLFANLKKYYEKRNQNPFDYLPETYLITKGVQDLSYADFVKNFTAYQNNFENIAEEEKMKKMENYGKNIWICKPGENSNRGYGITVVKTLEEIRSLIVKTQQPRTLIIQKYMQNPYLYQKRKFDIRTYLLITSVNSITKGYFYSNGYLRTTSKEYTLKNIDNKFIHLTNDAIQKKGDDFGRFQNRNKVTYQEFQKYVGEGGQGQGGQGKFQTALKGMKDIARDLVEATYRKMNPQNKQSTFELFGLDYMLDSHLQPFLIEANSNPCLEAQGSVLSKIIPHLIENTLRIAVDPLYPPPYSENWKNTRFSPGNPFQHNKFQLIFDSLDASASQQVYNKNKRQDTQLKQQKQQQQQLQLFLQQEQEEEQEDEEDEK